MYLLLETFEKVQKLPSEPGTEPEFLAYRTIVLPNRCLLSLIRTLLYWLLTLSNKIIFNFLLKLNTCISINNKKNLYYIFIKFLYLLMF